MKTLKCDKCPFTTHHRSSIINHRLVAHSSLRPWICTYPGCTFRTKVKQGLTLHSKRHDTVLNLRKPYLCTFENCNYRATRKNSLELHIKAKHTLCRTKDFQCPLCSVKFYRKEYLKAHIPTHLIESKFECKLCSFITNKSSYLTNHVKGVHERERRFKCRISGCNYKTDYDGSIRRHIKLHNPDHLLRLPFPCNFPNCSYRAPSRHRLNRHSRALHPPQKATEKFTCALCFKKLANRDTLTAHIKHVHTREKTYSCNKCSFRSYYSDSIITHRLRVHKEGKPLEKKFKCEFCDYCSSCKRDRDLHTLTIHTEKRLFKCENFGCSYATNRRLSMTKHVLVHEKDPEKRMPYACTRAGCDFRRGSKYRIEQHEQLHLSATHQLTCDLCNAKSYPDRCSLRFHRWIAHNKVSLECSKCDFFTHSNKALTEHVSSYHNNKESRQTAGRKTYYVSNNVSSNTCDDETTTKYIPVHTVSDQIGRFDSFSENATRKFYLSHKIPAVLLRKIHVEIL